MKMEELIRRIEDLERAVNALQEKAFKKNKATKSGYYPAKLPRPRIQ